jgi:hypothetical protein
MLFLKVLIDVIYLHVVALYLITAKYGRENRRRGISRPIHWLFGYLTAGMMLFGVVLTEIMVRLNGGIRHPQLFHIHIWFALYAFISVLLLLRLTGERWRKHHGKLAYSSIAAFIIALGMGVYSQWF